jgi:hypothetical protein
VRQPPSRKLLLSIVAGVIGTSLGVGGVALLKTRWTAEASIPAATATATAKTMASATSTSTATASATTPSVTGSATASPTGSAAASVTANNPPPTTHFSALAARQALDAAGREVVHCRRGRVWGVSSANVTFVNDGTVSSVVVGVPFMGTPTGQCVSEALSTARVAPFAGKPVVLAYRFFVPSK